MGKPDTSCIIRLCISTHIFSAQPKNATWRQLDSSCVHYLSQGRYLSQSTDSLVDVSAEKYSNAQTFKLFKHTRNPIQLTEGEHMWEPSTGQRMPPCPTVYALATLVFSQECLLCHLTTPLGIFQKKIFIIIQTISVNISQTTFTLILSAPWSSQESVLHFWLFPSEGRKGR